jgi:hypothetical protein
MSTALAKPARYPTWFVMLTAFIYGAGKWRHTSTRNPP